LGDNTVLWSAEGVQQVDPLGQLLFCLTIQPILCSYSSNLVAAYMDDVTVGSSLSTIADDITTITTIGPSYGIRLNSLRCEVISKTSAINHDATRDFQQETTATAMLLGAPLSTGSALTLVLLNNSLSAPKLLHTRHAARCVDHHLLKEFDTQLRSGLLTICNVSLMVDQWL